MTTYAFRCRTCGYEFERPTHADAVKCQELLGENLTPCGGWARRLWSVNVNIQNLKQAREAGR